MSIIKKVARTFIIALLVVTMVFTTSSAYAQDEESYANDISDYEVGIWDNYYAFYTDGSWGKLLKDENYIHELTYDKIYSSEESILAVEFGQQLLGFNLTKERYIKHLYMLIEMQEGGFEYAFTNQADYDSLKSIEDYAIDIAGIVTKVAGINEISAAAQKLIETVDVLNDLADINITTLENYKYIYSVVRSYESHTAFLNAIIENAWDQELVEAAKFMKDMTKSATRLRLEAVKDINDDVDKFLFKNVFSDVFFESVKATKDYAADESLKFFVDWGEGALKQLTKSIDFVEAVFELQIFSADMKYGTSDMYLRMSEIAAISRISSSIKAEILRDNKFTDMNDREAAAYVAKKVPLLQTLTLARMRGEYCLMSMVYQDAQALSLMQRIFFKDRTEAAVQFYANQLQFFRDTYYRLSMMLSVPIIENDYTDKGGKMIAAGNRHSAAIMADGSLWIWGSNDSGQIGDGTNINRLEPVKVLENVVSVCAGAAHTVAIKSDGSLWAWGSNSSGQLGNGTLFDEKNPIKIMENVVNVSAGEYNTLAITDDGTLWMWGDNKSSPVIIMDNVSSTSCTDGYYVAIKTDGTLWAWGSSLNGFQSNIPVKIMDNVKSVSTGLYTNLAIKSDSSLWIWGFIGNSKGFIENTGQFEDSNSWIKTPQKIMDNVKSVSAGEWHYVIIKGDNSLWAWGSNGEGCLGLGDSTNKTYDKAVKILDNVVSAEAGPGHTIAIKDDSSLWTWGRNAEGQIGDGTITTYEQRGSDVVVVNNDKYIPTKIME